MMVNMQFKIHQPFPPAGDQPKAIGQLTHGFKGGYKYQTLLGVTGSGKTYTMANVIQNVQKPTLVIAHNKTLAAQLAAEFRQFFPHNAVHYFVSYYDYYQPEAYIPTSDTYIEKDSSINDEIDRLRNAATMSLMSRSDVIIVASVSCIYGLGSPDVYRTAAIQIDTKQEFGRNTLIRRLSDIVYDRNDTELKRGTFRVKGDAIELFPAYDEQTYRITFFGDTVESITPIDPTTGHRLHALDHLEIFPARHFLADKLHTAAILGQMEHDMKLEVAEFRRQGRLLEAERLEQRTSFDLEMIRETGICNGIENYSRYFDRRSEGSPPSVLLDYFPKDYLLFIDESHMTVPQIRGMYNGDQSRKDTLIHYGFRLKAARDNRPLRFDEFLERTNQIIFVSATPQQYETELSTRKNMVSSVISTVAERSFKISPPPIGLSGSRDDSLWTPAFTPDGVVEQIIRPTGLVDPTIHIRPTGNQVDDLIHEIRTVVAVGQRVLVTTLTKRMAEDLSEYLLEIGIKVQYLHSEVLTLERTEILRDLRQGVFDVVVGINLLREGLDLPEVSLVAILDADREGFLRNTTSLIQTCGRAARHLDGRVIMYADTVTQSIKNAVAETDRRRAIQLAYNQNHGITPESIAKPIAPSGRKEAEEPIINPSELPADEQKRLMALFNKQMKAAAKNLEYEKAASLRDKIARLRQIEP